MPPQLSGGPVRAVGVSESLFAAYEWTSDVGRDVGVLTGRDGFGDGSGPGIALFFSPALVRPIPRELRIMADGGSLSRRQRLALLESWQPTKSSTGKGLVASDIYAVRLGPLLTAVRVRMGVPDEDAEKFRSLLDFRPNDLSVFDMRNTRDFDAHLRWAIASMVYSEALDRGEQRPLISVANYFEVDHESARKMIAMARQFRYLTASTRGLAGGEPTQKAHDFIETVGLVQEAMK
jgi:hypothetical protein